MRTVTRWTVCLIMPAALAVAGCGVKTMPTPTTYPVNGTVMLGSRPLAGGRLTLTPVDASQYGPAEATADVKPDGTFEPSAVGGSPGLMPGLWKVVVSATGYRDGKPYRVREAIPAKYTREDTTDLVIEVSAGTNAPTLVLKP